MTPAVPQHQATTIILAEHSELLRKTIAQRIVSLGCKICEAANTSHLLQAIVAACFRNSPADSAAIVVSGLSPGRSCLDALRMLRQHRTCPRLVYVASPSEVSLRKEARQLGALAILDRPLDVEALIAVLVTHLPIVGSRS